MNRIDRLFVILILLQAKKTRNSR